MKPPDRSLVYRVSRNGHLMAECDIDRIVELLDAGEFLWTDLCWAQGMPAWEPLSNLGQEIKAAKAFPPVAAASVRAASSRRRIPAPPISVPKVRTARAYPGWWWVVAGVSIGALVGLLTTRFFPEVVLVDRPVEKVVERPIEVIRTVEKRVEVPARLTARQINGEIFYRRFYDYSEHKNSTNLFNLSDRVKVIMNISGDGTQAFQEGLTRSKVESAFRSQGFKILSVSASETPYTVVVVTGVFAKIESSGIIAASYELAINQPVTFVNNFSSSPPSEITIKSAELTLFQRSGIVYCGKNRYALFVNAYEDLAIEAASELRKARDN